MQTTNMRSFSGLLAGWIVVILLVTGCKDGSPTGPDPISPSEENISASFEGDGSFVPGQFGEITIEGTSLSSDVYDATINDTEIELRNGPEDTTDSETLLFITPALPAGTHQMDITIEDQTTSLDVTIEEYEAINEPSEYIDGYISTTKSRLDTYSSDTDSDELKSWLEDILTNLSSSAENISDLDAPSMQQLAYILRENISIKSDELPATPKGCNEAQNRIDTSAGVPEEILILLKWGSANSLPGYDQTGNTVIANLTLGAFADPVAQVQTAYAVALKQCISEPVTQLEKAEQLKEKPTYTQLAETQSLEFFPGQSEAFYIRSTFTPPDELLIAIENFLASHEPLMEFISESVRTYFLEPPEELTQMRDPELFNIENISLGSVQHSQETDGDEIIMAFSYKQGQDPDEPQIFTFELADQENPDYPAQVEANLDVNDFDINLEFEGGQSDFLPGRLAVINQEAVTLDKESYDGLIDGEQLINLAVPEDGDDQLLFQVPELSEGQHTLKMRLAGRKVSIDFSVKSYPSIDDPETYTNDIINETDSKLETIQNETENQQVADRIQQVRDDLADSRSEFKKLSAEKKKMVARTIKTNIGSFTDNISSKAVTASFDAEKCTDLAGVLIGEKILIERGLKAIIATSSTSIVFGPVAAAVVAGVGIGKFMQSIQKVLDTYQEALDACLSDPVRTLQEDLANAKSAKVSRSTLSSNMLSFTHDESRDFYVQTTYTVFEEIRIAYNDYLSLLDPLFEYLPGEWKSKLKNSKTELTQVDDPSRFSISGISKSSISAEIQSKSEQIDLTFSYKQGQMPDSRQSFSFTLNDSELPDSPTTFEATLEPVDLPKVADQHITINKNETYKGALEGEFTDEFAIVETVQYGELTLDDPQGGNFTYTPAENLVTKEDHPDSFTYRGINDNGADTAQVTIEVVDNTPVAYDDEISVEINGFYDGSLKADNAEGFEIVEDAQHGTIDLNQANGDYRYTPDEGYTSDDKFKFVASNEAGESNTAVISITMTELPLNGTIILRHHPADQYGVKLPLKTIKANGTGEKKISEVSNTNFRGAYWNYNGNKILTVEYDGNTENNFLKVMNSDGSNGQVLDSDMQVADWSNLQNKIAYVDYVEIDGKTKRDVFTINFDGSEKTRITHAGTSSDYSRHGAGMVEYGPNGEIAYNWEGSDGIELHVQGVGKVTYGLSTSCCANHFSWSPDGDKLVYSKSGENTLWIAELNGNNYQIYTNATTNPVWSPDGKRIFVAEGYSETHVINASDGALINKIWGLAFVWSPDGDYLLVSRWQQTHGDVGIFAVSPDGKEEYKIFGERATPYDWKR